MYILKNHLVEYEKDKQNIMNLIEWKNIVNEWLNNSQYVELKNEIQDFQQSFAIMNKRTLTRTEWQQKLNIAYDEMINKNDMILKQNNLLMWMYTELKKGYDELLNENKNIKNDISIIIEKMKVKKSQLVSTTVKKK